MNHPERQQPEDERYSRLAVECNVQIVLAGKAVWEIIDSIPGYSIHNPDKVHPNRKASYLAACMIASIITGEKPGAPSADYDFTYSGMTKDDELLLRDMAWRYAVAQ